MKNPFHGMILVGCQLSGQTGQICLLRLPNTHHSLFFYIFVAINHYVLSSQDSKLPVLQVYKRWMFSSTMSISVGRSLAIRHGCKFIETCPGVGHNVDDLLVGMLTQIQLRQELAAAPLSSSSSSASTEKESGFKVMAYLEKVLKINTSKNKSCGNLHVL